VQLTPRHFPLLVGLPCASWHNTRSVLLQVPGPDWFLKCAEAMRALTSPVPILCTCMRRVVSAPPTLHEARTTKTHRREVWVAKRKAVPAATAAAASIKTDSRCSPRRSDSSSASRSDSSSAKSSDSAPPLAATALRQQQQQKLLQKH
jgi:hypothetical protein